MPAPDPASTDRLGESVSALLPALDAFNAFQGPDRAAPRSAWLPLIDESLPEHGVGRGAVLGGRASVGIGRCPRPSRPRGPTSASSPTTSLGGRWVCWAWGEPTSG